MKWFKLRKPKNFMEEFAGEVLTAYPTAQDARNRTNGERLKVEVIAGNRRHQTMFEINGTHLVSMLDAYSELNGTPLPSQETHEKFLSTVAEHIEPADAQKPKPSLIEMKRLPNV